MAKIIKNKKVEAYIPTSSMSDIAFLLLLFFMVSTVFVQERVFWVERDRFPTAESIERVSRNESATVYITLKGEILIDDFPRSVDDNSIIDAMISKRNEIPNLQVCFRTDKDTRYQVVRDVMMRLQDADTRNVVFESQRKL
jgi:biopolymer transport protein ExbD